MKALAGRPSPDRRYADEQLQAAYETGFQQTYDRDSFRMLDWVEVAVDQVAGEAERCRRRAAMLEGCAAALEELADRQHEGAAFAAELSAGATQREPARA
jgi:hypothetical protein